MSSDKRWVLSRLPPGDGVALDLGGGSGILGARVEGLGYRYVNLDLRPGGAGWRVAGDAIRLPFREGTFDVVLSCDSLEHFHDPLAALSEVARVLKPAGRILVWVPFMHPFHGDDYFRFTPLGLRLLFDRAGLEVVRIEAPLWAFSVMAQGLVAVAQRLGFGRFERLIEATGAWLDCRLRSTQRGAAFAQAYLVEGRRQR